MPERPGLLRRSVAEGIEEFWIYIVGPVVGATLGALAYQLVRRPA